jgi:flavin-dependent dehydrogenase
LRRAEALGTTLRRGQTVRRITPQRDAWHVHNRETDSLSADAVFLATGKHDVRGLARPGAAHGSLGMKMYLRLTPAQTAGLVGIIMLVLFPGGYAGLQCVEAGRVVLCLALSRARFQSVGADWSDLLTNLTATSPYVEHVLAGARHLLTRPLAVAGVPYGFLHRSTASTQPGLFRLGDQAAVIPSLTGDGIAIALHSGTLAATTWLGGEDSPHYHRRLGRDLRGQMRLAGVLHSAGTTGLLQAAALRGAEWLPGLLRQAARSTRVRRSSHIGLT